MKKIFFLCAVAFLVTTVGYGQRTTTQEVDIVSNVNWAMTRQAMQNMAAPGDVFARRQQQGVLQVEVLEFTAKGDAGDDTAPKTIIKVVPDPKNPSLSVHFEEVPAGNYILELISQNGDQVPIESNTAAPGEKLKINFSTIPFGTYYLRINMMEDRGFFRAFRVIKK